MFSFKTFLKMREDLSWLIERAKVSGRNEGKVRDLEIELREEVSRREYLESEVRELKVLFSKLSKND